jgi:S1-C subfamily serine protease
MATVPPARNYRTQSQSGGSSSVVMMVLLGVLAVVLCAGVGLLVLMYLKPSGGGGSPAVESREVTPKGEYDPEEREAVTLFKNSKESVVNVDTVVLRRGFGRKDELLQAGTGSGFLWDDAGHVVTNFHVIQDAIRNRLTLRVVLADRSEWKVTIVGVAPEYDIAVLKISDQAPLKKIKVGTSKDLEVGQKCYAIGNPFGLSLSLTKGIISALDREIESPAGSTIPGVIQTDAPINPGNSGGPLLDKDGRLIGVNTQIATAKGGGAGNIGIGFAVPVDVVNWVVPQLIRSGKIVKPSLGITLVPQFSMKRAGYNEGVMVASVEDGSPAAKAGLRPVFVDQESGSVTAGDVILSINGVIFKSNDDYERMARGFKLGDTLNLSIRRGDRSITVEVVLPR